MTFNETNIKNQFKANVFIDWLNIKANGGQSLDFKKLLNLIREQGGLILRANIYLPEAEEHQIHFYDAIKAAGFKIIYLEERFERVNCDTKMVVDIITQSLNVDAVYILTNDADFIPAISYLQTAGKRVLLIHGDNPSNNLRRTVDEWRHLRQLDLLQER